MTEINQEHLQLLSEKLLRGTITKEEHALLERWYATNPAQKPVWNLNGESKEELERRLFHNLQQRLQPVKKLYPVWARVSVAAVIVAASAVALLFYLKPAPPAEIKGYKLTSTMGGIRKIVLPDHSLVWLKGESSLEYPAKFSDSTRNVVLHGEALFEVSKDKAHPFVIRTGNYITRVLGTSFNIRENQQSNAFKLTVLTGKVLVTPYHKNLGNMALKSAVLVTPGKELELISLKQSPVITIAKAEVRTSVVKGTEYDMNLNNISFAEVKLRIEKKFNVEISTSDAAYKSCLLSADVTDQSLENTIKIISAAIGAVYKIDNSKINITGGGCN